MAQNKRKDKAKKRVVQVEQVGQVHIRASFNNIIISITNMSGQVISWGSAGKMGFRGSKKNTPYAAQTAAQSCAQVAYDLGMRKAEVFVKGFMTMAVSRLSVLYKMWVLKLLQSKTLRHCHIMAAALRNVEEFSF